ncbi:hypothetical protein PISMIDRAFT_159876 [Pisolithus microcarpus 441]|uniref:Uncharacterized protein n=1 Tax=Pisolithus microcarpus 441 TaxID=765257 RepID=A0A0C9Y307_9AGAM|nr:hypothetical protein BKA83DRAFT_159876 [Pisolithus microcarpus]KIK19085.1 hypothetical protein PISMIDRAFT_159876 [Pisolithus microcarpus 441]
MQSKTTFVWPQISRSQSRRVSFLLTLYDYDMPSSYFALLDVEIMRAGPHIRELSLQTPVTGNLFILEARFNSSSTSQRWICLGLDLSIYSSDCQ